MIYFGYGSNLCLPRFVARVPSARFIGVAKLAKSRVVFYKRSTDKSGKATILKSDTSDVYGALFSFDEVDLPSLRRAEGFPKGYDEQKVVVLTLDGEIEAMTYIATKESYDESQMPYDWYVDLIRFGGRRLGLPEAYISQFDSVPTKKDDCDSRSKNERAHLR